MCFLLVSKLFEFFGNVPLKYSTILLSSDQKIIRSHDCVRNKTLSQVSILLRLII